jgi:hypothetical protein
MIASARRLVQHPLGRALFHQSSRTCGLLKNVDPILSGTFLKIMRDAGQ